MLCFASSKVPTEARVTNNLEFLSLDQDEKVWARTILDKYKNYVRKDISSQLVKRGYDINQTSKYIEDFYLKIISK